MCLSMGSSKCLFEEIDDSGMSDFRTRVHFVNVPAETLRLVKKIS